MIPEPLILNASGRPQLCLLGHFLLLPVSNYKTYDHKRYIEGGQVIHRKKSEEGSVVVGGINKSKGNSTGDREREDSEPKGVCATFDLGKDFRAWGLLPNALPEK